MSLLLSQPNICFLCVALGFWINYNDSMFTCKSNPQEGIFKGKSRKFAMSVEARGFILVMVKLAHLRPFWSACGF